MASVLLPTDAVARSAADKDTDTAQRSPRRCYCEAPEMLQHVAGFLPMDRSETRRSHSPARTFEGVPMEALPSMRHQERLEHTPSGVLSGISGEMPAMRSEERRDCTPSNMLENISGDLPVQRNPTRRECVMSNMLGNLQC